MNNSNLKDNNKKRKLETINQEIELIDTKFLLNNSINISLQLNLQHVCERSTLLRGLFESTEVKSDHPIKLTLQKPQNFCILLDYLQTGKIPKELKNITTIVEYINDAIYLGIEELEIHAIQILKTVLMEKKGDEIDFTEFRPNFDFIKRLMKEASDACGYELIKLLMNWAKKEENYDWMKKRRLAKYIRFDKLNLEQTTKLAKNFPQLLDTFIKPSNIFSYLYHCVDCGLVCSQQLPYCPNCRNYGTKLKKS